MQETFVVGIGQRSAKREQGLPPHGLFSVAVLRDPQDLPDLWGGKALLASCLGSAPTLTERERECLSWAATGKTAAEVATALSLSKTTIIYHLTRARRKLDAANSRHAITKALSLKLIASA